MSKITRDELDEYARINAERKDLDRKSKNLETREKQIVAKAMAELKAAGKSHVVRYGYALSLEKGRASVSWKDAYVDACGAEAATVLQEAAIGKEKAVITVPVAASV